MRVNSVKMLFQAITQQYFAGANVIFSHQSRAAKPTLGLVVLIPGPVRRPQFPNPILIDGVQVSAYASRINFTVDLFTHGSPVIDPDTGDTVAYENTATDDMLSYVDYLNSHFVNIWSQLNDVTILTEGDVTDLTGAVNDNNYEFRARLNVVFYFTQYAVGAAGVLDEDSIRYPVYERDPDSADFVYDEEGNPVPEIDPETGDVRRDKDGNTVFERDLSTGDVRRDEEGNPMVEIDPETGLPRYTTEPPQERRSPLSDDPDIGQDMVIEPEFTQPSTGGGSEELAGEKTGYFTEVDIKQEEKA